MAVENAEILLNCLLDGAKGVAITGAGRPHVGQKVPLYGWAPMRVAECDTQRRWALAQASKVTAPAY